VHKNRARRDRLGLLEREARDEEKESDGHVQHDVNLAPILKGALRRLGVGSPDALKAIEVPAKPLGVFPHRISQRPQKHCGKDATDHGGHRTARDLIRHSAGVTGGDG
jgi:hypothetical protein